MSESRSTGFPISTEVTPNPATMKFVLGQMLLEHGTEDYPTAASAARSPLATRLFGLRGVSGVFLSANFVTVTKVWPHTWETLVPLVEDTIREHLASGEPAVLPEHASETSPTTSDDPVVQKILDCLNHEIRPAVAGDGGDVTFVSYEKGIVTLHLKGACSGCPSSTMTLKMGIEMRLKELVPEVEMVEALL